MKYLALTLIATLVACSSSEIDKLNQQVSQLNSTVRIQDDRIKELETSQVRLNERIERSEFKNLSYKEEVLERSETEQKIIDQTYSNNEFLQEVEPSLEVRIVNQTSSLVPLRLLEQHRQETSELPLEAGERFITASQDLIKNKFLSATLNLQEFSKQNLPSEWQARSEFWLGVAAEGMKEYHKAVSYYSELMKDYPDFQSLPVALYRQGNLFARIGEPQLADLTYQKLIKDYADSPEAELARKLSQ